MSLHVGEPELVGERDSLCSAVDVKLRQDPLDVPGHRLGADEELPGDFPLILALGEQP